MTELEGNGEHILTKNITVPEVAISFTLAVITTVGNLLVVTAVYKDPLKNLRTTSNYLVVNLAVADLIVGLISEPLWALQYWIQHDKFTIAANISLTLAVEASCLTVLFLTIERYIVLEKPLSIQRFFNHVTLKFYIFMIWLIASVISLLALVLSRKSSDDDPDVYNLFVFDGVGLLLLVVMLGLNIRIVVLIRKFNRSVRIGFEDDQRNLASPLLQSRQELLINRKREQKIAVAIFFFVGVFAFCWLPALVTETIRYFNTKNHKLISMQVQRLIIFLGLLNSALNPVIYSMRMQNFRRAITCMSQSFIHSFQG